jgi:hypothetical protein
MNEAQLIKAIKALVEKGDRAKDKAEQHDASAGIRLNELRDANEMSSSSDYGRRAILRQLREDGIDIATIIPADSVKWQRGAA